MALTMWDRLKQIPATIKGLWGAEGSWRGPFSGLARFGQSFVLNSLEDGWQRDLTPSIVDAERFGPVYACVAVLSQEQSRIPIKHYRKSKKDGSRVELEDSAVAKIFRKPNNFQTRSDFILYMMRSLLLDGNAYAVAIRDEDYNIIGLYPVNPRQFYPYIAEGEVYYAFGDDVIRELGNFDDTRWFPQRDVLHIRMHCPVHPLIGESPITAALLPTAAGIEINKHTTAFFHNMSRPSGILKHPGTLGDVGIKRIKEAFMQVTQKGHTGEPIVLQEEMEWSPLTMSAVDAELVNSFKLTERQIAQVFRVPPFLLGDLERTTLNNVETLSRFFIQSALGFYVDHFEGAFASFFGLPSNEYIYMDVETALLRSDLKERMDAYAKGVQSGVMAPNEARARESLPPVEFGDDPRVQQQLVPLSYGVNMQPPNKGAEPEPPPPEPTEEELEAASYVARKAIEKAMR